MKIQARNWPPIYRAGKNGTLFWQGEVVGSRYRSHSGLVGGTVVTSAWSDAYATNEGKANARTPHEQAVFIIEAKQTKLLKSGGYFSDIANVGQQQFVAPMLAHKYDEKKPPRFPVYVQRKLNGVRCVITREGMFTRNGEAIVSCPHIFQAVKWAFQKHNKDLVLDGELYNHDLHEDLNELVSLVRKKNVEQEHLERSKELVEFHAYDCFFNPAVAEPQHMRLSRLHSIVTITNSPYVVLVQSFLAHNQEYVRKMFESFLNEGYEGAMLRDHEAVYVNERTKALLKFKPREDAEFEVIRVEDGNGKRKGKAARVICRSDKGVEFAANVKWPDQIKERIWAERDMYPGSKATVSYAYITAYGKPFHPYVEKLWGSRGKV